MNKNNKMPGFSLKWVCIIIVVTSMVTSLTTCLIIYNNSKIVLGSTSIKDDDALREFLRVYNSLDENYYENINKTEMIEEAISAMLKYLGEDYSTYMNQKETDNLAEQLSGKFLGIGISIINGREIFRVYDNTPASKVGLQKGDIIININNKSTENLTQIEVANLIDKKNENTLIILREEKELTYHVTAEMVNTPLTTELIERADQKIGYIFISAFTNTVEEEFKKSVEDLEKDGMNSLIIDMRGNAGGYLKGATAIANMFLEKGKIIYSLEGKDSTETTYDETDEKRDYKVVILLNESSASASEVLASAFKDSYGATIIGTKSYGKGRVQQTKKLEDGSMVKYTTAKWLRPNGECIDGIGITPDYEIDLIEKEDGKFQDTQLEKALELLG